MRRTWSGGHRSLGEVGHQLEGFGMAGTDHDRGHGRIRPDFVALLDALDGADEGKLVAELVGDGLLGLLLTAGEEEVLDAPGGVAVAVTGDELVVEVLVAGAHAADVEGEVRLHRGEGGLYIVG